MAIRFRYGGQSFLADEIVYHAQLREFCTVVGVDSEWLWVERPSSREYGTGVDSLVRNVDAEAALAARLRELDTSGNLEQCFISHWRGGGQIADFRAMLQLAAES